MTKEKIKTTLVMPDGEELDITKVLARYETGLEEELGDPDARSKAQVEVLPLLEALGKAKDAAKVPVRLLKRADEIDTIITAEGNVASLGKARAALLESVNWYSNDIATLRRQFSEQFDRLAKLTDRPLIIAACNDLSTLITADVDVTQLEALYDGVISNVEYLINLYLSPDTEQRAIDAGFNWKAAAQEVRVVSLKRLC